MEAPGGEQTTTDQPDATVANQATLGRLGHAVRSHRRRRGLTLKELSSRSGISISMLSMLERGVASASLGTVIAVASALQVEVHELFQEQLADEAEPDPVVRRGEHPWTVPRPGVVSHVLTHDDEHRVDVVLEVYEPRGGHQQDDRPSRHGGFELGFVVAGTLTVAVGDRTYTLSSGDTITYDSDQPHRMLNGSDAETRVVWLNVGR